MLALFLITALLISFTGCRRRITPDAQQIVYETYPEEIPDPNLPAEGQVEEGPPQEDDDPEYVFDPTAPPADKEIAAQGGEGVKDAPEPPETGPEIKVTLDPNGGECSTKSVTVNVGGTYGELPQPIRPGYTFKGWFSDPEAGYMVDPVTVVTVQEDHMLYAQWSDFVGYTVTFDPNGGRISPYRAEKKVFPGESYGALPTPYYDGYIMLGWYTAADSGEKITEDTPVRLGSNQTLYAHWQYDPYAYWSYRMQAIKQSMFSCRELWIYLELTGKGATQITSPLISDGGSQNVAQNLNDPYVTDGWIREKKPDCIVKITDNMGQAEAVQTAMEARFPGKTVYVLPREAVEGTDEEKLYYTMLLASLLYPEWYYQIDMDTVAEELGVQGDIYK